MRSGFGWHHAWAVGAVVVLLLLHWLLRWQLTPIVPVMVSLPLLAAFTYRQSLVAFGLLLVVMEVFSPFFPGVAALVVGMPYILGRRMPEEVRLWSSELWLGMLGVVAAQLAVFVIAFWLAFDGTTTDVMMTVPWVRLGAQWLAVSGLMALIVGIWHELRP